MIMCDNERMLYENKWYCLRIDHFFRTNVQHSFASLQFFCASRLNKTLICFFLAYSVSYHPIYSRLPDFNLFFGLGKSVHVFIPHIPTLSI